MEAGPGLTEGTVPARKALSRRFSVDSPLLRCGLERGRAREETTMGSNADTVRSGWDAFAKGDMDAATATTSDSAEIIVPETLPWGGTYRGPDGFKEMIGKFVSNFDEINPDPQEFIEADGGRVLVTVSGTGKTKSGNELSGDSIWLYKLDDGKIERAEFFGDTAQAVNALA